MHLIEETLSYENLLMIRLQGLHVKQENSHLLYVMALVSAAKGKEIYFSVQSHRDSWVETY